MQPDGRDLEGPLGPQPLPGRRGVPGAVRVLIVVVSTCVALVVGLAAALVLAVVVFPLDQDGPVGDCNLVGPTSGWQDASGCPISQEEYDRWLEDQSQGQPAWVMVLLGATVLGFASAGGIGSVMVTGRFARRSGDAAVPS